MAAARLTQTFCHLEIDTCNNDIPTPEQKLPIESRLVNCLRAWHEDPNAIISDERTVQQEIVDLLEWYICECIPYGPNSLGGWWSDGVIHLEIDEPSPDKFKLLGVTWIDCHGLAPFEIDVELDAKNNTQFAKTIFRLGMLDAQRRPKICNRNHAASRLLETRPRYNRDWAMAIELTPLRRIVTEQNDAREPD